jgi:hypothetical protein
VPPDDGAPDNGTGSIVRLETNRLKTQAMICTPGRIRTQLPTASYHRMRLGFQTSEEWEARRITCSHCDSLHAGTLPPAPPSSPSRGIPVDCGCRRAAGRTREQNIHSGAAPRREITMPCRWLHRGFEGWVEHAASLPRSPFSGQSDRQEGRAELPTMYILWDANGPEGPRALEDGELFNRSRQESPAQNGSCFGTCPSMYLYSTWGCLGASRGVQIFRTPPCSGRR